MDLGDGQFSAGAALGRASGHSGSRSFSRRTMLKAFAAEHLDTEDAFASLREIVRHAVEIAVACIPRASSRVLADAVVGDLKDVLVGTSLSSGEPGSGRFFCGRIPTSVGSADAVAGSEDPVRDAMSGLFVGYHFSSAGDGDVASNDTSTAPDWQRGAAFRVGRWLHYNPNDIRLLPEKLESALSDAVHDPRRDPH